MFDVRDGGTRLAAERVFHDVTPGSSGGFRSDEDGQIWTSAGNGVHCIALNGELMGLIKVPFTVVNLAFGGRNRSQLFICASHTLFAIVTSTRGAELLAGTPSP